MSTPPHTLESQFRRRVLRLSLAADRSHRQRHTGQGHHASAFCLFAQRSDVLALLRQLGAISPPQSTGLFFSRPEVYRMLLRGSAAQSPAHSHGGVVGVARQLARLAEFEARRSRQWAWNSGSGGRGYVRATAATMGWHYDVILGLISLFLWEHYLGNI